MAYFSKEIYERKAEYAINKQLDGVKDALEKGLLTEEQVEGLMRIAELRHRLHSMSELSIFNSGSQDSDTFADAIDHTIADIADEYDLPRFHTSINVVDIPSDFDYFEVDDEGYGSLQEYIEDSGHFDELCEIKEKFNTEIEDYLKAIDNEYGTSFCPTGATRIM